MVENRFAQLKENFEKEGQRSVEQVKPKRGRRIASSSYNKKGRYPFALHEDVRYDKLEALVDYHGAKSASDYLEKLIIKEFEKMRRKLR